MKVGSINSVIEAKRIYHLNSKVEQSNRINTLIKNNGDSKRCIIIRYELSYEDMALLDRFSLSFGLPKLWYENILNSFNINLNYTKGYKVIKGYNNKPVLKAMFNKDKLLLDIIVINYDRKLRFNVKKIEEVITIH